MQTRNSIRGFVRPSIRWSVGPSVRRSVGLWARVEKRETSVLKAFCVCVCVGRGVGWGVGCGWGLAAPAHLSATILWPRVTCFLFLSFFCFSFFSFFSSYCGGPQAPLLPGAPFSKGVDLPLATPDSKSNNARNSTNNQNSCKSVRLSAVPIRVVTK